MSVFTKMTLIHDQTNNKKSLRPIFVVFDILELVGLDSIPTALELT